ncbi:MAG: hypothetical protein F6K48_18590 [Okeania sp. SIO3H1]|uniref:hypothetical protein n=1 Tax=Okeania sp. SIO1I7 TaxID=2607772 RepID=UPI0013C6C8B8|nr:hypothetical protein [Okeania sp. SIO1I7]NEN90811.1 hypothetical protein [Okeania sp. SIO3H1]NET28861.1 hypothetical protein [Okeania sp. SIO1I7]
MREGIKQEVCGHIQPLRLGRNTTPGSIQTLIDWQAIADYHQPSNSINYIFKGQLEYLQCDYYITSLSGINSKNLPQINKLRETNLQKQTKYFDFKRRYNVRSGHAVELMLHTKWGNEDWGMPKAGEFLYNLGQYGYLNFFDPYLLKDAEILYSDIRYKIGASIDGAFGDFDIVEINGGYSGTITYFEAEFTEEVSENAGSVNVGEEATQILSQRSNRKILFVSNDGDSRLYFRFANSSSLVSINSPFLEPGESLSIDFNEATWSGGNQHQWVTAATKYYLTTRLYGIREAGDGKVGYQEFY